MLEPIRVFPKRQIPEHWVIQSGLRDAVPDVVEVAVTKQEAVDLAGRLFDLSEIQQTRLELFGYVYQSVLTDGADYVELYQCRCEHIDWHYKSVERRHARQDTASRITISVV